MPYLIVAAVCAALVVFIEPSPAGSSGRVDAGPAFERDLIRAADVAQVPPAAVLSVAPAAVLSSVPEQPIWAPPTAMSAAEASPSPDGTRLFLAGLILVSLAAAARRG
jgi:hypothetical protein